MLEDGFVKMDDTCKKILEAMYGLRDITPDLENINSRLHPTLDEEELKDRLEIMADKFGYVTVLDTKALKLALDYAAILTALGRQFVRDNKNKK